MGLIHLYHGDGKGKTTSSIGLGIRAAGYQIPVIFTQFLKNDSSSEIKILRHISGFDILHGKKQFGFYYSMTDEEKVEAKTQYTELLQEAIQLGKEKALLNQLKQDEVGVLLILDEVIDTYNLGLVDREELINFLSNKPNNLEVVLTGRNPSDEIISLADYISEVKKVKHPYDNGIKARRGIEI